MSTLPTSTEIPTEVAVATLPQSPPETPQQEELPPISTPAPLGDRMIMIAATVGPLVGTIVAIWYAWQHGWMGWSYLALFVGAWAISGMGVTIGFHRLLTHSSFETFRPIRAMCYNSA